MDSNCLHFTRTFYTQYRNKAYRKYYLTCVFCVTENMERLVFGHKPVIRNKENSFIFCTSDQIPHTLSATVIWVWANGNIKQVSLPHFVDTNYAHIYIYIYIYIYTYIGETYWQSQGRLPLNPPLLSDHPTPTWLRRGDELKLISYRTLKIDIFLFLTRYV
jgi:hypothetical protein